MKAVHWTRNRQADASECWKRNNHLLRRRYALLPAERLTVWKAAGAGVLGLVLIGAGVVAAAMLAPGWAGATAALLGGGAG